MSKPESSNLWLSTLLLFDFSIGEILTYRQTSCGQQELLYQNRTHHSQHNPLIDSQGLTHDPSPCLTHLLDTISSHLFQSIPTAMTRLSAFHRGTNSGSNSLHQKNPSIIENPIARPNHQIWRLSERRFNNSTQVLVTSGENPFKKTDFRIMKFQGC